MRLVVNQHDKHGPIDQRTMENAFGMAISHVLPHDPGPVREASTQGLPLLQVAENSPIARAVCDMARQLYPDTRHQRDGLLRKLFGQASQVPAPVRA
jgi:pilus assembly protein CpaE